MQIQSQNMKVPEYPANWEAFEQLMPFAQKIITLCTNNKIYPVLYGSFAVFYHTNNKGIEVNDIDLLLPKRDFPRAVELLEREMLEFKYIEAYPDNRMSTIIVRDDNLQVELDEVGTDYSTITEENILRSAQQINFYGLSAKIVTHEQIADIYRTAYYRADNDKAKLLTRLKLLESDVPLDSPDPTLTELKALLLQHSDKRVCVVGTTCTGKSTLLVQIPGARDQDKEVFPKLTEEEKAFVCQTPWTEEIGQTMTQFVRERVLSEVEKPVFGTVVIDCDLIVLLKISDELLAKRVTLRNAQFSDAKSMQSRIEAEVRTSGIAYTEFSVG